MMSENLTESLSKGFTLVAKQINESSGRGYRLSFSATGNYSRYGVDYYKVQLCGINPLTGRDVENDHIIEKFSFEKKINKTEVLTYHGKFMLRCTAYMEDGRVITFREQPISLNYPKNTPYVKYTVSTKGDFKLMVMESNCWGNCEGKIWIYFDGHAQRVALPVDVNKTLRFYVPASGSIDVRVQDENIRVTNGR